MRIPKHPVNTSELSAPEAAIWRKAPSERIDLIGTPVALQPSPFIVNTWRNKPVGKITSLNFSALHNGEVLALRLSWADPHLDVGLRDNDRFPDGAAVMFPLKGDAPLFSMGSPEQPVNAWHWRADRPTAARNNIAMGLGSSRVTGNAAKEITTVADYKNGHWQVIFLRKLMSTGSASSAVQFASGATNKIAFAVWEGSNGERGGLKAFSPQWRDITLA